MSDFSLHLGNVHKWCPILYTYVFLFLFLFFFGGGLKWPQKIGYYKVKMGQQWPQKWTFPYVSTAISSFHSNTQIQKSTDISYRTWPHYGEVISSLPPTDPNPHFMHGVQLGQQTRHPSFTKLMQLTYYVHLCLKFRSVDNGGSAHNQHFFLI